MNILKHKTKEKYIFINQSNDFVEYFIIEKFKNKIQTDLFDLSDSDDKKLYQKFIDKQVKKGFKSYIIPKEIKEKANKIIANFELDKTYYFVEKNKEDILKSNVVPLSLIVLNGEYRLYRISSENEDENDNTILPTLANFISGFIASEKDELTAHSVAEELSFYINLLFILDFELLSLEQTVSLCTIKTITKETIFEGDIYKSLNSSRYFKVSPRPDLGCIQFINYTIENNTITNKVVSYTIESDKKNIDAILENFKNPDSFEKPIPEKEFLSQFKDKTKSEFFEIPTKQEFELPRFPLESPTSEFEIDDFSDILLEENKYYFFANREAKNPLDWQVMFIVLANEKEDWYLYSNPFSLKDFNTAVLKSKEVELSYSDDRKDFTKKIKKKFKKAAIESKSIDTNTIFKILSGKSLEKLNVQKCLKTFVCKKASNTVVATVFENYVCMQEDSINHLYWQFFKGKTEREKWLKENETTEVMLYKDEISFILKHTHHYIAQNNPDTQNFRKSLIENPLLKRVFSDSYDIKKFQKSTLVYQKGEHIKGDFVFSSKNERYSDNKTIIIEGDLCVDGTLFFKENNDNYIIIKGDLKAKNLIVNWNCKLIYIEGKVEVKEITKSYFRLVSKNAKTNILLHKYKEALDISSVFEYKYEVSYYSNAVTNKEVIKKDKYGSLDWDDEKIYQLLTTNQPFLADKIENTKTDLDEYYKNRFERRMLDWGYFYPEYAGCENLGIGEDNQIKGNCIYPGSGDWVVNDLRGKSGTYGVSHEDYSMCKLKVKHPKQFNIDYKQKPLKLKVNAEQLMNRYIAISMLYMNWAHRKTVTFSAEVKQEETYKNYESEKSVFVEDPHLALYWLNHFGATLDSRYDEVVTIIEENNLIEKLPLIKEPLAFFKKTDAFYNLEIQGGYSSDEKEFKDLFLKRRSYLIYWEQVYKNYNPDNLELWWKSITIYPKIEEQLIVRMRWLKNNLNKCNNWDDFDVLIKDQPKDIPLLSYIFACNPNTTSKEKTKNADILISELLAYKDHFKTPHKKSFAEIILWDVREFVSNKKKLEEVAKFYFQGNETCKEYQDIQSILGVKNKNINEIRDALEKLNTIFEGYDRFDTPKEEKEKYHNNIEKVLAEFKPEILLETLKNIRNHELAKRCFVYLWNAKILNKKEVLVKLFIYIEFAGYDISKEIFGDNFSNLIKDKQDSNLEIAKTFLDIPEADFRNDSMWKSSKEAAVKFFLGVAHLPEIFEFLIAIIKQKPSQKNTKLIDAVYTKLFSEEYDSKINPTLKFNKVQIETMLETICDWFLKYGYHAEGYRSIYYCANPLAEDWIKERINNKKWLNKFAHISTFYAPLDEELNEALESALEFIEDEKHNADLVFKDDKSQKFWKIEHYGSGYTVTYGKIGTEGQSKTKEFDSREEAYKVGDKLIASKLKKGYKK